MATSLSDVSLAQLKAWTDQMKTQKPPGTGISAPTLARQVDGFARGLQRSSPKATYNMADLQQYVDKEANSTAKSWVKETILGSLGFTLVIAPVPLLLGAASGNFASTLAETARICAVLPPVIGVVSYLSARQQAKDMRALSAQLPKVAEAVKAAPPPPPKPAAAPAAAEVSAPKSGAPQPPLARFQPAAQPQTPQ